MSQVGPVNQRLVGHVYGISCWNQLSRDDLEVMGIGHFILYICNWRSTVIVDFLESG